MNKTLNNKCSMSIIAYKSTKRNPDEKSPPQNKPAEEIGYYIIQNLKSALFFI